MNILNSNATVQNTAASVILPDRTGLNSKRTAFVITNVSTLGQIVYIAVGQEAVSGKGIPLSPGGSFDRSPQESPPQQEFTAIASAANAALTIYEESE